MSELERLRPLAAAASSGSGDGGGDGEEKAWTSEHDAKLAEWIDGFSHSLTKAVREATAGLDALVREGGKSCCEARACTSVQNSSTCCR